METDTSRLLIRTVILAVTYVLLHAFFVTSSTGQAIDSWGISAVAGLADARAAEAADTMRHFLPIALALLAAALALYSCLRGRVRQASSAIGCLAAIILLAQAAKGLPRPYLGAHGYVENTLPSGHVAVAAGSAVAVLWLWPSRRGIGVPCVVLGLATFATMMASVVTFAHRPADVIAAALGAVLIATVIQLTTGGFAPRRAVAWAVSLVGMAVALLVLALGWLLASDPGTIGIIGYVGLSCACASTVAIVLVVGIEALPTRQDEARFALDFTRGREDGDP